MRVCPKCKFIDPPEWKHCKFSFHIDTITWENFKRLYPELAVNIRRGGDITEDEDYYYRLTKKSQVIMRKAKIEWTEGNPFGAEKYEKFNHGTDSSGKWQPIDKQKFWQKVSTAQTLLLDSSKQKDEATK